MGRIPSLKQVAADFQQDVAGEWRGPKRNQGVPVYRGRQKALLDYLIGLCQDNEAAHQAAVTELKSEADILRRGRKVRQVFRQVQGLAEWPQRTPLRATVSHGFESDGYRVQHVILESRPGLFVTANLYLPTTARPPYPAVLYVCGHSADGKGNYQRVPAHLAMKGIAALVFDPAGQGERDEYVDVATGQRTVIRACRQHGAAGEPMYLTGSNFGAYRLWDAMRCVDYLQSRDDIQGRKIGVSGISGGGWEALWLAAIDTRIAAINSNCCMTTYRRRVENRAADAEPDPEQDPFGLLVDGVEAADLLVACYPRPVSLGATIHDYFPIDGALQCYTEAQSLYALAGKQERIAITVSDAGHENTPAMRAQTYCWMQRWLKNDPAGDGSEREDWKPKAEATINCTKTGIVLTGLGGKTTGQLNAEASRELAEQRQRARQRSGFLRGVPKTLRQLLAVPAVAVAVAGEARFGNAKRTAVGGVARTVELPLSDGGLTLSGHLWTPSGDGPHPAMIYLAEKPEKYDGARNELCRRLAGDGMTVLDLDVRGMGPGRETWLDFVPLVEATLSYDALLLGRPLVGMRTADVLAAVDWLIASGLGQAGQIAVHGREQGALLALFAGCLDERISAVVEERSLSSYASLTWHRSYAWPVNVIVPGILQHMDLCDIRAALAPRKLTVIEPLDHLKQPLSDQAGKEEYRLVRQAYRAAGASRDLLM